MSPEFLHPFNQWYHVAFVCKNGELQTYVNGEKELARFLPFNPMKKGKTSFGARQNKISWFKGAIYAIRVSPSALNQHQFRDTNTIKLAGG